MSVRGRVNGNEYCWGLGQISGGSLTEVIEVGSGVVYGVVCDQS